MTFPPEVWDGVLRRLQEEIAPVSFEMWISQISARLNGDCLELVCPTQFHCDRVRDFFLTTIGKCVNAEAGRSVALRPVVAHAEEAVLDAATVEGPGVPTASCKNGTSRAAQRDPKRASNADAKNMKSVVRGRSCDTQSIESAVASTLGDALGRVEIRETASHGPHADPNARTADPRHDPAHGHTPTRLQASTDAARSHLAANPMMGSSVSKPLSVRQPTFPLTFETFTVGSCNALAREAAMALAGQRSESGQLGLNQLFIVSGAGLGKTHLARAVVNETARVIGERARYTTAEGFTSEFTHAVRADNMQKFKRRYRTDCELLVVDDVQFLEGKVATQLEFFHTVQHVLDCGGRVLLTGDKYPQELTHLDERVRSRIASGFVAEVEAPDETVRRNILRAKAAHGGVRLPEDCLDLLVQRVDGSVRELEGALIQLVTVASLFKRPIDLDLTEESLEGRTRRVRVIAKPATPEDVIETVAGFFKTSPESLASRSRRRDVLVPRQLSMYLCRRYTDASLADIGRALKRDHPSVANAIRKMERQLLENVSLRYQVEALIRRLDERGHRPLHPAG